MTGSLADMVSRLWAVLPKRWFAEQSPNLSAILQSLATPWAWLYRPYHIRDHSGTREHCDRYLARPDLI